MLTDNNKLRIEYIAYIQLGTIAYQIALQHRFGDIKHKEVENLTILVRLIMATQSHDSTDLTELREKALYTKMEQLAVRYNPPPINNNTELLLFSNTYVQSAPSKYIFPS